MSPFIKCIIYLATIGIASFILGRIVPKRWFCHDKFPYCSTHHKEENDIYNALGIRKWKGKFPDISVILPGIMPSKRLPKKITSRDLELMIQETCIAEWIHSLLSLLGFGCVFIWKNTGGWIISILYALGNLPYIIIQRDNRPKLLRLLERFKKKNQEVFYEKGSIIELQYGSRT